MSLYAAPSPLTVLPPSHVMRACGERQDKLEDWQNNQPWRPCQSGWCAAPGFSDHVSCSIVNARVPYVFGAQVSRESTQSAVYDNQMGLILNPRVAKPLVACGYSADGGTQGAKGGGCGHWCTRAVSWQCSWPPGQLKPMLEVQEQNLATSSKKYNEVVLRARGWEERLPHLIEAVFFVSNEDKARRVHSAFQRQFGHWVPLLRLDLTRAAPFSFVSV